jgi:hypothetical protein
MDPAIFPCFQASAFVSARSRIFTPEPLMTLETVRHADLKSKGVRKRLVDIQRAHLVLDVEGVNNLCQRSVEYHFQKKLKVSEYFSVERVTLSPAGASVPDILDCGLDRTRLIRNSW